jgi:hypothetical protein
MCHFLYFLFYCSGQTHFSTTMPPTVLVINPYVADFKLYDEWMHPLGLYFLLSILEKNGIAAHFFNCLGRNPDAKPKKFGTGEFVWQEIEKPALYRSIPRKYKLYGRPQKELRDFLATTPQPDLICIGTMMTHWLPGVVETVKVIRELHPQVPLLIGGIAARLMPSAVNALLPTALVCAGVLEAVGTPQLRLHDTLPPLRVDDSPSLIGGLRMLDKAYHGAALISQGCPFACSFCASPLLAGKFRFRPRHLIIEEIAYFAGRFGISDVAFYDDALLVRPREGIFPLLKEVADRGIRLRFHAPNGLHLQYLSDETARTLKAAGFATLRFGYESGAASQSSDISEKINRKDLGEKIACVRSAGFAPEELGVYVMAGLWGQPPSQVLEEMEFVASCGVKVKPVFLSPVPGTPLFERYARLFPQIKTDPLWHNDVFFITKIDKWDWEAVEKVRIRAKELNQG